MLRSRFPRALRSRCGFPHRGRGPGASLGRRPALRVPGQASTSCPNLRPSFAWLSASVFRYARLLRTVDSRSQTPSFKLSPRACSPLRGSLLRAHLRRRRKEPADSFVRALRRRRCASERHMPSPPLFFLRGRLLRRIAAAALRPAALRETA